MLLRTYLHLARDLGEDIAMGIRFTRDLPSYVRTPVTCEDARRTAVEQLATREQRFLDIVQATIYRQPRSPYRRLLAHAGCESGDLRTLVRKEGVEGALRVLADRGVYVAFDEFKGRRPAVRGSARFDFVDHDFDNFTTVPHYLTLTSGSGGRPTRTRRPLDSLDDGAQIVSLAFEAHGIRNPRNLFWFGAQPSWPLVHVKMRQPVAAWFYPITPMPLVARLAILWLRALVRLGGQHLPAPVPADLMQPGYVVDWLLGHASPEHPVVVNTRVSSCVRIAQEAQKRGAPLAGVIFHARSEPLSPARKRQIEAAGAAVFTSYGSMEFPWVAYGCPVGVTADDVHLRTDTYAATQHARPIISGGPSMDALLLTSLNMNAGKIAFNTETGDAAHLEERTCGCSLGALGYRTHLSEIRSFEKLSSEGTSFARSEILKILEETLPARFGGSPIDYQIVEEEADDGGTRLILRVHPEIGPVDEEAVRATLLGELARGGIIEAYQAHMIRRAESIVVQRAAPLATTAGKVLPFQLMRHARQPDTRT